MTHPYVAIAPHRHWMRAPGLESPAALDPAVRAKFTFSAADRLGMAGSCFAQHLMRALAAGGFPVLVSEQAPALVPAEQATALNYGVFSTRSGDIYTARQLRQWLERATGAFTPRETVWESRTGGFVDPFRPSVTTFMSEAELQRDRARHLAAVRSMIDEMDVFVFTLGLTEAWADRADGAVFPLAPGVLGGRYDPERHALEVHTAEEVATDLRAALDLLAARNRDIRVILSVSPVPLMATGLDRHVLVSTIHTKATLVVAAHMLASERANVAYFPAYEIVTAPHVRGAYFGPDCREVTTDGVAHVIRVFLEHYCRGTPARSTRPPAHDGEGDSLRHGQVLADVLCDEDALRDV